MKNKKNFFKKLFFISLIPYVVFLIIAIWNMFFGIGWVAGEIYGFDSVAITVLLCFNNFTLALFIAILVYQIFYFIYSIVNVVLKHKK